MAYTLLSSASHGQDSAAIRPCKPVVTPPDSTRHQAPASTSTKPKELLLGKDGGTRLDSRSQPDLRAREPHIDIADVIGSIPIAPTIHSSYMPGSLFDVNVKQVSEHDLNVRLDGPRFGAARAHVSRD
jgi:hypothetical protein